MFCKNCGAPMDDTAKFCPKCGKPVEDYTAPKPFEKNSVDGSQNYQYQTSTFTGKQYSTGTNGQINFGTKHKSLLGTIIKIAVVGVIVFVIIGLLFPSNPVYGIRTGTSMDYDTYQTVDNNKTSFSTSTPTIFVSFSTRDIEIGRTVYVEFIDINGADDVYLDGGYIDVEYDEMEAYLSFQMPSGGWPAGDFEIRFFIDDDYVTTVSITIE